MSIANRTLTQLRALRLTTMAEAYENQLQQPKLHEFGFDERLAMLVDQEQNERESRKLKRLIIVHHWRILNLGQIEVSKSRLSQIYQAANGLKGS